MSLSTPIRIELPTGLPVGTVNAYLFTDPEAVLVDAGVKTAECWDVLTAGLAAHGLTPKDLSQIVITHAHVDHFGLAAQLVEESGATVRIAEPGVAWVTESGDMWQKRMDYYRDDFLAHVGLSPDNAEATITGMRALDALADPIPKSAIVPFKVDGTLSMGGATWQSVFTPGHASMQTCFYELESRQFLSADMLLSMAPTPVVEQPPEGSAQRIPALPQFMDSLNRLEPMDIGEVYPGHGEPFTDHRALIARYRARILDRKNECLRLVDEGVDTAPALVERMYANYPRGLSLPALWMMVGYLDLLQIEGCIQETTIGGVWHYTLV